MTRARELLEAALVGYLAGSVSFTRLLARLTPTPVVNRPLVRDGDVTTPLGRFSPSSLGAQAGHPWGVAAGVLEILKGAAPTWWWERRRPGSGAAEAAMFGAVLGHVFPLFHRFRGGYGQSPLVGGLLVLDPESLAASVMGSSAVGVALADAWVAQDGWPLFVAPWAAGRGKHRLAVASALVGAVYLRASWPEFRRHFRDRTEHPAPWRDRIKAMPGDFGETLAEGP